MNDNSAQQKDKVALFKENLSKFDPAELVKDQIDAPSLRKNVMNQIVALIKYKVAHDEMTDERAKQIADFVLQKLPSNIPYENLMNVIPELDNDFQELSDVVVPIMVEYEEKIKEEVSRLVNMLISEGRLDDARKVIKTSIEFEKKLS